MQLLLENVDRTCLLEIILWPKEGKRDLLAVGLDRRHAGLCVRPPRTAKLGPSIQSALYTLRKEDQSGFKMLLLDYQNVLIESLLKDRFSG